MKYLIILISFIFILGCTKVGKNMTVKGRVMNPITGEGIPDIPIELQKTSKGLPGGFKTVKTIYTNENGNFEISKGGIDTYYLLVENLGNYYRIGWSTQGEEQGILGNKIKVKKRKVMHADYYAVPYGSMKYTIKNTSCFDQNDVLVINRKYQLSDLTNSYIGSSTYNGCFEFIGNVYSQYPMGWHYMSGYYTKNNITTNFSDSIYIDSGGFHEWIFGY